MAEHEIRVIRPTKGDRLDEWLLVSHPSRADVASDTLIKMLREVAGHFRTRTVQAVWMSPDFSYLVPSHRDEPIDFVFASPALSELAVMEFKSLKTRTPVANPGFQFTPFSFGDIAP